MNGTSGSDPGGMAGRQRVFRAIEMRSPDRIPIVFWNHDQARGDVMLYHLSLGMPVSGFGHYPGRHSDMDAFCFQLGALMQAGLLPTAKLDLPDGRTLSWGHAMQPDKVY